MRKLRQVPVSYQDNFLILYRIYMMTGSFHISLFKGIFHVDKIHVRVKIASITHVLPVPVYRQTDFTAKRAVVSHLHDTAVRFRTRVEFSPLLQEASGTHAGVTHGGMTFCGGIM